MIRPYVGGICALFYFLYVESLLTLGMPFSRVDEMFSINGYDKNEEMIAKFFELK